jgi:hypothetical protein
MTKGPMSCNFYRKSIGETNFLVVKRQSINQPLCLKKFIHSYIYLALGPTNGFIFLQRKYYKKIASFGEKRKRKDEQNSA